MGFHDRLVTRQWLSRILLRVLLTGPAVDFRLLR